MEFTVLYGIGAEETLFSAWVDQIGSYAPDLDVEADLIQVVK